MGLPSQRGAPMQRGNQPGRKMNGSSGMGMYHDGSGAGMGSAGHCGVSDGMGDGMSACSRNPGYMYGTNGGFDNTTGFGKRGIWNCASCTFLNPAGTSSCCVCGDTTATAQQLAEFTGHQQLAHDLEMQLPGAGTPVAPTPNAPVSLPWVAFVDCTGRHVCEGDLVQAAVTDGFATLKQAFAGGLYDVDMEKQQVRGYVTSIGAGTASVSQYFDLSGNGTTDWHVPLKVSFRPGDITLLCSTQHNEHPRDLIIRYNEMLFAGGTSTSASSSSSNGGGGSGGGGSSSSSSSSNISASPQPPLTGPKTAAATPTLQTPCASSAKGSGPSISPDVASSSSSSSSASSSSSSSSSSSNSSSSSSSSSSSGGGGGGGGTIGSSTIGSSVAAASSAASAAVDGLARKRWSSIMIRSFTAIGNCLMNGSKAPCFNDGHLASLPIPVPNAGHISQIAKRCVSGVEKCTETAAAHHDSLNWMSHMPGYHIVCHKDLNELMTTVGMGNSSSNTIGPDSTPWSPNISTSTLEDLATHLNQIWRSASVQDKAHVNAKAKRDASPLPMDPSALQRARLDAVYRKNGGTCLSQQDIEKCSLLKDKTNFSRLQHQKRSGGNGVSAADLLKKYSHDKATKKPLSGCEHRSWAQRPNVSAMIVATEFTFMGDTIMITSASNDKKHGAIVECTGQKFGFSETVSAEDLWSIVLTGKWTNGDSSALCVARDAKSDDENDDKSEAGEGERQMSAAEAQHAREDEMREAREFEDGEADDDDDDDDELEDDELAAANERAKKRKQQQKKKDTKKPAQKRAGTKGGASSKKRSKSKKN